MMPKGGKSTDHDHNLISSEGAQDTSTCKISDHSLHAFSGKCPETSSTDGRTDGQTCRKTVTVGPMDQRTHVQVKRGYFRLRKDGRTDNIMPPAPKGKGITKHCIFCKIYFAKYKFKTPILVPQVTCLFYHEITASVITEYQLSI